MVELRFFARGAAGLQSRAPRAVARSRGFTMVELLAVVTLIGLIAVAAAPSVLKTMEDNRVQKAAYRMAELVRFAKARSLGRGAAVLVSWDVNHAFPTAANPNARLSVREAIEDGANGPLPSSSCSRTGAGAAQNWADNSTTSRYVAAFDDRTSSFKPAQAEMVDTAAATQSVAQICFTPRGRTFVRYATAGAFTPLTGVVRFTVKNPSSEFVRQVIVPPNGVAHVVGRI